MVKEGARAVSEFLNLAICRYADYRDLLSGGRQTNASARGHLRNGGR